MCKQELFSSDTKYDSGCGWPAFYDVLDKGRVTLHNDPSLGNLKDNASVSVFVDYPIHDDNTSAPLTNQINLTHNLSKVLFLCFP